MPTLFRSSCHGKSRPQSAPAFRPRFCDLDKKVLRFHAHFNERVSGHADQPELRVRKVHILYYLEDDTIAVTEPKVQVGNTNLQSGSPETTLVHRTLA